MIQPGKYLARATGPDDVQFGRSGNGNEQVAVLFRIVGGECDGDLVTWFGTFTDKATEITVKALRACGWNGVDLTDMTGIDAEEVQLVVVEEEDQNGELRIKVKWVNKPGGKIAMKDELNPEERRQFAQRMKGYLIQEQQGKQRSGGNSAAGHGQPQRQGQATQAQRGGQSSRSPQQPNAQRGQPSRQPSGGGGYGGGGGRAAQAPVDYDNYGPNPNDDGRFGNDDDIPF